MTIQDTAGFKKFVSQPLDPSTDYIHYPKAEENIMLNSLEYLFCLK